MTRVDLRPRFACPSGSSHPGGGRAPQTPAFDSTQRRAALTLGHTRRLLSVAPTLASLWDTFRALPGHTVRERAWTNSTETFKKSLRCFSKRANLGWTPNSLGLKLSL